jgi:hypothetical protein
LPAAWSVSQSRADTIYVACALDGTIRQYATNGTGSIFARASLGNPQDLAFDKAGNLYVANYYDGTVMKFDPSGNGTIFATGLDTPTDIVVRRNGNIILHPMLTITRSGTNAIVRWTLAANFNLKTANNLVNASWLPVSGTIFTNGSSLALTNPISSPVRFFWLSNP